MLDKGVEYVSVFIYLFIYFLSIGVTESVKFLLGNTVHD